MKLILHCDKCDNSINISNLNVYSIAIFNGWYKLPNGDYLCSMCLEQTYTSKIQTREISFIQCVVCDKEVFLDTTNNAFIAISESELTLDNSCNFKCEDCR